MSNQTVTVHGTRAEVKSLELKYKKKFTYGLNHPFTERIHGEAGFFKKVTGLAARIDEVIQVVKTDRGSRVMLPNFGAGLSRFLFEPISEDLLEDMRDDIIETLETYLPEVEIISLDLGPMDYYTTTQEPRSRMNPYNIEDDENNTARVSLRLRNRDLQDIFSVVIVSDGEQVLVSETSALPSEEGFAGGSGFGVGDGGY